MFIDMRSNCLIFRLSTAVFFYCICLPNHAAVNDVFPTDYIALKDGTLNSTFYLSHRELKGPYSKGDKLFNGAVDSDLAAIRLSYHMNIGQHYTFAPVAVMSWVNSQSSLGVASKVFGDETKGLTDLRLGGSFWFHRDYDKRQYAAVSLIAAIPTGHYDEHQILNAGENRWKWILGGGIIFPIGERLVIDLSPEVAWYGDNNDYLVQNKLEQEVSYALTGYLRYKFTPDFQLVTGAQVNRGGANAINGIDQHNAPENTRLSVGILYVTSNKDQWQLRYSNDLNAQYGFRTTNEVTLRLTSQF